MILWMLSLSFTSWRNGWCGGGHEQFAYWGI